MQECNSVKSTCNPSAWAGFAAKLTATLTVTETKISVLAHGAFLRHMLTNPLEHGDATIQHDTGVQILADVFVACSAEPQSHPNGWLGRSTGLSLGTWPSISTNIELLSMKAKSLPSCCTMLTSAIKLTAASSSAATTTMSSSTKNFVLAANQFVKIST